MKSLPALGAIFLHFLPPSAPLGVVGCHDIIFTLYVDVEPPRRDFAIIKLVLLARQKPFAELLRGQPIGRLLRRPIGLQVVALLLVRIDGSLLGVGVAETVPLDANLFVEPAGWRMKRQRKIGVG
ncbi:MAG: hypothetical protein KDA59_09925 [Planctomycetales bacterium]|nr:hypothetical protein [Planctomycetales bacterium]